MTILDNAEGSLPRRILAVVTVGRYTCAAPILEICKILHSRGHSIELACLEGWQHLAKPHEFISKVHVVGRNITPEEDEALYRLFDNSVLTSMAGRKGMMQGLMFFNQWWPETYTNLKELCTHDRPDFIFGDLLADACIDIMEELKIPLAMQYPQMPMFMAPQPYIPGFPGLQHKHLTSEHASIWERFYEEFLRVRLLLALKDMILDRRRMRRSLGVPMRPPEAKPNYLVFVNSFFGLEAPKDLPPLMTPVGPIIADTFQSFPEDGDLKAYLESHHRVLYVAFGSHVNLPSWRIERLIKSFVLSLDSGHIDGVIWALKNVKSITESFVSTSSEPGTVVDYVGILQNADPRFKVMSWAPQRAILSHPSTRIFLSHCGASSTMEAVYHGVPVVAMPVYMDQLGNGKRLEAAGVALQIDRHTFTAAQLHERIKRISDDTDGSFGRNVLRMQRIAKVNSRRKYLAADLIEEVLYDHELRFERLESNNSFLPRSTPPNGYSHVRDKIGNENETGFRGRQLRPMHLQTADSRMSKLKASNWDLWITFGALVVVPITLFGYLTRSPVSLPIGL